MWADKEKPNWLGVWSHLSHCPSCHTLMNSSRPCPKCGFAFGPMKHPWFNEWWSLVVVAALSLVIYYWAKAVALPVDRIRAHLADVAVIDAGGH